MQRAKRVPPVIAVLVIAALAIASAIMGQAVVQALGLQDDGVAYGAQKPPAKNPVGAKRALAAMPLAFVRNEGQTDPRVRFYAVGNHYAFFATPNELMLSLTRDKPATQLALALRFVGHSTKVTTTGARTIPGKVNYLRSTDPSKWQTKLSRYRDVVYTGLWPHIDLHLHQAAGALKYEFHVHPGARPSDIRLAYAGATGLALDKKGALRIKTGLGTLKDAPPVSYQRIAGKRVAVHSRYVLRGSGKGKAPRFAFAVGSYRHDHVLIIDPGIQFTTFLGGAAHEAGNGIAVDGAGNSYIAGTTQSPDFPTTPGAFRRTGSAQNNSDVFVTKLNPAGTALVYSTFVGGSNLDFGNGIAIDASGNAYVTGTTKSSTFPVTGNAFDRSINIPPNCPRCATDVTDGFVFKLNAAGSALTYSTFLGGTDIDSPRAIAVDGAGSAFVTGEVYSNDFPTTAGAFRRTMAGQIDMFVTKLNATGSALTYSTYLGGTQVDNGSSIKVDASGNAYALGFSSSTDFPTTPGAFDTSANGAFDATLTKLNPAGSALVYSTYLGGDGFDDGNDVALDGSGNAYVTGQAGSVNFPTTPGAFDPTPDGNDVFVTKFNAAGSAAVYSTVIGGTQGEVANGHRRRHRRRRVARRQHLLDGLPGVRGCVRSHVQRRFGRRVHLPAERRGLGAAVQHVPGRVAVRAGDGHRPRLGRQPVRHGHHVLAELPGHDRGVRHDLQRRPVDLLGRRVRHEGLPDRRQHAARASGRAACADAAVPVQRLVPVTADRLRLERRAERGRRTRSRSTIRARSPLRSCAMCPSRRRTTWPAACRPGRSSGASAASTPPAFRVRGRRPAASRRRRLRPRPR